MNRPCPSCRGVLMRFFAVGLLLTLAASTAHGQAKDDADYIRAHYQRFDVRIPMRDGIKLYTSVYSPRDGKQRYPILVNRTPYGVHPYEADKHRHTLGPNVHFHAEKY